MMAGIATTTTLSWVYASTTWAVAVGTGGAEVIMEVASAAKQLVNRASWVGEQVLDTYGELFDKVMRQAGDIACFLMVILAAVFAKQVIYDFWKGRADNGPLVLPWWGLPTAPRVVKAAPGQRIS